MSVILTHDHDDITTRINNRTRSHDNRDSYHFQTQIKQQNLTYNTKGYVVLH